MRIRIPCQHRRFSLRLTVRAEAPMNLGVHVYDPQRINTFYIRRRVPFEADLWNEKDGIKSFSLPFPKSPSELTLELFDRDYRDDVGFEIIDFSVEPIAASKVWEHPEIQRFVKFAERFAIRAGHLPTQSYDSKNKEFLIEYLPEITDHLGRAIGTPARINRSTGRIQISAKQFRRFTIPVRLFILLHERYHLFLNTRRERPPDRAALKTYLELGYPGTEALYATSKVFLAHGGPITKGPYDRVIAIGQYIDEFNKRKEKTTTQVSKTA
jgi:hypothetical protein